MALNEFSFYLRKQEVVKMVPDSELAKSLARIGRRRFENLPPDSEITDRNSFQVVENAYEAVRELIDALMSLKGYKSYSHEASIAFLREFHKVPGHIINMIDRYRRIRNDIKYRGLLTTAKQGIEAKKDLKEAFNFVGSLLK